MDHDHSRLCVANSMPCAAQDTAFLSRLLLVGAYFISVTYYLQLLAAFLLNIFNVDSEVADNIVATTGRIGLRPIRTKKPKALR